MRRGPVTAVAVAVLGISVTACGASPGAAPGSRVGSVTCPADGPVRASQLADLAACDLTGRSIVLDVGDLHGGDGAVQNPNECSETSEGPRIVVCTFPAPVGTGGFVGDGADRAYFGSDEAVSRVKELADRQ